ncbi:MAG: hypothetical protein EP346_07030 [Bacteroidetes bacterium]|nr:MAG: hypothetical protein EP346_07030 [Bacteroidota bacterium]
MAYYRVNNKAQSNGDHEVHKQGCDYYSKLTDYTPLGDHDTCHSAIREAKKYYAKSNGCYYCSNACHTS